MNNQDLEKLENILATYREALESPDPATNAIIEEFETDLKELGSEAVLAGKRILSAFHQEKLNALQRNTPAHYHEADGYDWADEIDDQSEIAYMKGIVRSIDFEIEVLSENYVHPGENDPISKDLIDSVYSNSTISEAKALTSLVITETSTGRRKTKEYAIELTPKNDGDPIILHRDDLEALLTILTAHKPN